jgi:hypothetical protein
VDVKQFGKPNPNIIENEGGQLRSLAGPKAAEVLKYRTLIIGLDAEARGMKLTRGVSCTKMAKEITGLRTNNREVLKVAIKLKMNALISECLIINEEDRDVY